MAAAEGAMFAILLQERPFRQVAGRVLNQTHLNLTNISLFQPNKSFADQGVQSGDTVMYTI
jgi:hypothetical protein